MGDSVLALVQEDSLCPGGRQQRFNNDNDAVFAVQ
jgi:hypothetical protein